MNLTQGRYLTETFGDIEKTLNECCDQDHIENMRASFFLGSNAVLKRIKQCLITEGGEANTLVMVTLIMLQYEVAKILKCMNKPSVETTQQGEQSKKEDSNVKQDQ